MPEEYYDRDFPNLKRLGFLRTSEPADYNCFAFAAGDIKRWWWPSGREDEYWPLPLPKVANLEAFIAAFATLGYVPCSDGTFISGIEKVAIYSLEDGNVQHAAIQVGEKWRSKLGPEEDIEHDPEGLEGPCYGKVVAYLQRTQSNSTTP